VEYAGDAMEIGFNSQYLLEFLSVIHEDNVSFEFKDEQSAGLLRPQSEDGVNYRYVVMPMRI
jgi:DNA polymerase III subunit beta